MNKPLSKNVQNIECKTVTFGASTTEVEIYGCIASENTNR